MSQILQKIDNLGRREAATLATATTQRIFATLGTVAPPLRQGVHLNNCDASADLFVTFSAAGASAPTISATDHDLAIPPKTSRQLLLGSGLDVWVRSSSAGSVNYTAVELL